MGVDKNLKRRDTTRDARARHPTKTDSLEEDGSPPPNRRKTRRTASNASDVRDKGDSQTYFDVRVNCNETFVVNVENVGLVDRVVNKLKRHDAIRPKVPNQFENGRAQKTQKSMRKPKDTSKENRKEIPKENLKEKPKENPNENPKEKPKERPSFLKIDKVP